MKKSLFCLAMASLCCSANLLAQHTIEVTGNVKFLDQDPFKMVAFQREGFNKKILSETVVDPTTKTYKLNITVDKPGKVEISCGQWQGVNIWVEDENLKIDFRGADTAKIKIKNPPYVYINGGKNNEIMNWMNWTSYRNYQNMIAISQNTYRAKFSAEEDAIKQKLTMDLYDMNSADTEAYMLYLLEHYADRSSIMAVIASLNYDKHQAKIEEALDKIAPKYPALVADYRKAAKEAKEKRERMLPGRPLPQFEATLAGNNKKITPADFKGKVLVLDFWASWCGPCRMEIPHLKEYYNEFKGKDVEFLSVSIDAKDADWQKAMKEENMPWLQAHVPNAGKEVMELYQFSGIPFILVIDKDGNIYKKSVRGEEIRKAIQEVLDGKKAEAPQPQKSIGVSMMGASM